MDVMYKFGVFSTSFYTYKNNDLKKQEIIAYQYELIQQKQSEEQNQVITDLAEDMMR